MRANKSQAKVLTQETIDLDMLKTIYYSQDINQDIIYFRFQEQFIINAYKSHKPSHHGS